MKNLTLLVVSAIALIFSFCKKEEPVQKPAEPSPYYVRMTDAPGNFSAVYVDIQSVEITGPGGKNINLNVNAGIYNLLDFSNGADTLIATGSLTVDKVQQIRLILGPNNSVVVDSVTYPLTIPSGAESGLKLNVHHTLQAGVAYEVLLDFDANQSVVLTGNGSYVLKPVIRTVENALSGSIAGQLSQAGVSAAITATNSGGAYSSVADSTGAFMIQGVPAGNYDVIVLPAAPYSSVTVNNVSVTTGVTTTLGVLNI